MKKLRNSMSAKKDNLIVPVIAACAAVFIWGASPAATLIALADIPEELVGAMRSIFAALILSPLIWKFWNTLPSKRNELIELVIGGASGFAAYPLLLSVGIGMTSASHSALILAAAPISTGIISFVLTSDWPSKRWWFGGVLALCGIAVLMFDGADVAYAKVATLSGNLVVLMSVIFASIGYVFGGRTSARIGHWPATLWLLVTGAIILAPLYLVQIAGLEWRQISIESLAGLAFLVVFVTIVGYVLWFWALGAVGAKTIAPLQFGQPVIGVVLAMLIFSEPFTRAIALAGSLVIGGVVLSLKK